MNTTPEPFLRIQETVVRRHAPTIAVVLERIKDWGNGFPFIVNGDEVAGVRAALVYALAILSDPLRCRYDDCAHPVASGDEQVTCPVCRQALGLPEASP